MANVQNLVIERHRTFICSDSYVTGLGNPVNLTGCTVCMTIKNQVTDPDSLALYKNESPAANWAFGTYSFELTPTTTTALGPSGVMSTSLVYDVTLETPLGRIYTVKTGTVTLIEPCTHSIP